MPRLPRLQYPGAIYHLVTRGDGRRKLFHDQGNGGKPLATTPEEYQHSSYGGYARKSRRA